MTITVEELRRKYPNPVTAAPDGAMQWPRPGQYCVGGALCLELGTLSQEWFEMGGAFPSAQLFQTLRGYNPNLSVDDATEITRQIIDENDQGNFDVAWAWLDKGLTA